MDSLRQVIVRSAVGLALFAVVTAGFIAVTHAFTADRIAEAEKRARSKALLEIIPAAEHDNDLLTDSIEIPPSRLLGTGKPTEAYIAKKDGLPISIILTTVAPDGYSGEIWSIVGIDYEGRVKGARVIAHKETPGLGDKIELRKSDWILSFNGKSLENPETDGWKVAKDGGEFDQMTGATITPRAVVGSIKNALLYFQENRNTLLPRKDVSRNGVAGSDLSFNHKSQQETEHNGG